MSAAIGTRRQVGEERRAGRLGGGLEPGRLALALGEVGRRPRYCSAWAARVSQAVGGITSTSRSNRSGARTAACRVGGAAHRCAADVDAIETELVEQAEQVGGELRPLVGGRVGRSAGLAVAGGVVAHDLATSRR